MRMYFGITAVVIGLAGPALAQDVQITDGLAAANVTVGTTQITISRSQDTNAVISGEFAKTSRPCPEFCIQPMIPAVGITPVGELELITFLQEKVDTQTGLLIDARVPDWFDKGAIPGAINVPFAALAAENPYQSEILRALGAVVIDGDFDFSGAMSLMVYGNGPWDAQGSRAVQALVAAGYPASLIQNYRGGLEDWLHLGLSTVRP
jgi:rhodanese-related sulfurtransferase